MPDEMSVLHLRSDVSAAVIARADRKTPGLLGRTDRLMLILKEVRDVAQVEAEDIHSVRVDRRHGA